MTINALMSSRSLYVERQPIYHWRRAWGGKRPLCGASLWQGQATARDTPDSIWIGMPFERARVLGRACKACFKDGDDSVLNAWRRHV